MAAAAGAVRVAEAKVEAARAAGMLVVEATAVATRVAEAAVAAAMGRAATVEAATAAAGCDGASWTDRRRATQ